MDAILGIHTHINVGSGRFLVYIGRVSVVDELKKLVLTGSQPGDLHVNEVESKAHESCHWLNYLNIKWQTCFHAELSARSRSGETDKWESDYKEKHQNFLDAVKGSAKLSGLMQKQKEICCR